MNYGPFKVTLTEQQVQSDYCIRSLLVHVSKNYEFMQVQCYYMVYSWISITVWNPLGNISYFSWLLENFMHVVYTFLGEPRT